MIYKENNAGSYKPEQYIVRVSSTLTKVKIGGEQRLTVRFVCLKLLMNKIIKQPGEKMLIFVQSILQIQFQPFAILQNGFGI